jgi:hypothetical protein
MYLAFLLIVFYMLCILIFIYIISQYFFIWCFIKYVYLRDRCRTCTCSTCSKPMHHSGTMHLTWTCEMRGSWIVQHILDNLRMTTIVYFLMSVFVSFIHDFGSITLLFSNTLISGVWSENSGVMLPKLWTEDT